MKIYTQGTESQKKLFGIFVITLSIIILVRDLGQIDLNKFILLGIISTFLVFFDKERVVWALCFMIPLFKGIPQTYVLLVLLVVFIAKGKKITMKAAGMIGVVLALELFSAVQVSSFDTNGIIQYILCISFLFILINDENISNYRTCMYACFFGTLLFCVDIVSLGLMTAPSNWLDLFVQGWFRFGGSANDYFETTYMHMSCNANELAYFSSVGFAIGFPLFKSETNKYRKIFIVISMIIILICGALSVSRSYILTLFLLLFVFILINLKSFKGVLSLFLFAFVGVVSIVVIKHYFPELIETITMRFSDADMATGNGRSSIFASYNEALFGNIRFMLFGTGATCYKEATGIYSSTHAGIQQIFLCLGLPVGLIFIVNLMSPVFKYWKQEYIREAILPIIAVIAFTQTIQFLNPYILMLPFIVGVFALKAFRNASGEGVERTLSVGENNEVFYYNR